MSFDAKNDNKPDRRAPYILSYPDPLDDGMVTVYRETVVAYADDFLEAVATVMNITSITTIKELTPQMDGPAKYVRFTRDEFARKFREYAHHIRQSFVVKVKPAGEPICKYTDHNLEHVQV